jgi:4-diphosphocytidyl-2-C-methyl-D-erythritol kinase
VDDLLDACRSGDADQIGRKMFNRLQSSAERLSPWVKRASDVFDNLDFVGHQMSGSGTAYFGVCRHARHARRLTQQLRAADLGAVFSATSL